MSEHARLSPSGAERWMTCPGSVRMEDAYPDETSPYAAEGTAMHTIREKALRSGKNVAEYLGEKVEVDGLEFEVTAEWVTWLQPGIDWVREQATGGELFVEERVHMDTWIPDQFGTVDTLIVRPDLIIVNDFKGGRGVVVDADNNLQMMLYALGAWDQIARHKTEATDFLLVIDQPRVRGQGSEWRTTLRELLIFAEKAAAAALRTLDPNAELVPSIGGCRFCKAAKHSACYALDQFVLSLLGLTLEDLDKDRSERPTMIEYDKMDPERRSYVLTHISMIRSWLNNLHANALSDAQSGVEVPGFKAVATLGDRAWTSEAEAEAFWKGKIPDKDLYTRKLKSPAQVEKLAGTRNWKKAEDTIVVRPEGKPALVPEDDPRPALIPLTDLLDDLDDDPQDDPLADLDDLLGDTEEAEEELDDLI